MIFALLLFNLIGFQPIENTETVSIQLKNSENPTFEKWVLRLDDGRSAAFNAKGTMTLSIQDENESFEILDEKNRVRFFGIWSNYSEKDKIVLEIAGKGVFLSQVVSASRIQQNVWEVPAEIGVVKPEDQAERETAQTSDWLKERSEVTLQKTNLGGGSPIIRGMSGNRVLLMVDGFRLNNSIFRLGLNQYLNTVPGSQLEQIEILNGPSGVQYGSDGLGGTVHLRSSDPATRPGNRIAYRGLLSTADGTHSQQVSGQLDKNPLFVQAHVKFNNYEDLEAASPVGDQAATGYESWDGSLNLTYSFDEDHRLRFINHYSTANHVPRTDRILSGRDLLWEYHPQDLRIHGIRYEDRVHHLWADYFDIGFGYLQQDEGVRRISSGNPNRLTEDRTRVRTNQLNGTFTKITQKVQWVYGFDSQWDALSTRGSQTLFQEGTTSAIDGRFPNDARYTSLGAFGSADIRLNRDQHLKAGLRQSWYNLEGTLDEPIGAVDERYEQLTPSLTWSLVRENYFFSLGVSQGFRAPNIEDALTLGPSNSGFDAPNPGLGPEELWSYEFLFRWRAEMNLFQVSLYTARYRDLIERVPGDYLGQVTFEGEPVFILDNVGRAKTDGISLRYQHQFDERFSFQSDASWVRGTQTDRNEPMRRIPPLRGNLSGVYEAGNWRLSSIFSWSDRQDRLSPQDIADSRIPTGGTPGYGVLHLRSRYTFRNRISVTLSIENLGDKLYKQHGSGVFEPGRRALLAVEAKWQ